MGIGQCRLDLGPQAHRPFAGTLGTLDATLREHGVAVLPGVLSLARCAELLDGAWKEMGALTRGRLRQEDPSSWRTFYELFPLHSMLLQHWGAGHQQWAWDVRQDPAVAAPFARLWGTEDLIVSFDGVSFHLPPKETGRGWYRGNNWFRTCPTSASSSQRSRAPTATRSRT
jgi:hypothetical protein